jgi:hypothetical protein
MTQKITLQAWAAARFDPVPNVKTLQRWARDGWIYPSPERIGKPYYVDPNAVFIGRDPSKAASFYGSQAA